MQFNKQFTVCSHLGSLYQGSNICFSGDTLYTPILNTVKAVDLQHNCTITLPMQTTHEITKIAISHDGVLLVAVDRTGMAVVFNLRGNFMVAEFNFKAQVASMAFSHDDQLFAVAMQTGFVVYEAPSYYRTFEPFLVLKKYRCRHSGAVTHLEFSPDSRFLLTSGEDNMIYLNNLFRIEDYMALSLEAHRYKVISMHFSPEMDYLYSWDSGANLYIWKWVSDYLSEAYTTKSNIGKYKRAHHQEEEHKAQQEDTS